MSSEVFSTPRSCDSTSLVPGEFLKITWMKQKTVEQGPGLPWLGGRANSAFPWCCSMINRDKERKERRKLINTIGIPARICLSQVIRILTSCLEKKTGNKSLGDKICLGGVELHQADPAMVGVPKKLLLPVFLGLKAATGACGFHGNPTPCAGAPEPILLPSPHTWEKPFRRQLQVEGVHFLPGDFSRTNPGRFGMGSSRLWGAVVS